MFLSTYEESNSFRPLLCSDSKSCSSQHLFQRCFARMLLKSACVYIQHFYPCMSFVLTSLFLQTRTAPADSIWYFGANHLFHKLSPLLLASVMSRQYSHQSHYDLIQFQATRKICVYVWITLYENPCTSEENTNKNM